jgi:hypothetical protein
MQHNSPRKTLAEYVRYKIIVTRYANHLCELQFEVTRWNGADLDIFLYGLDAKGANDKLRDLMHFFASRVPSGAELVYVRTPNTVTFISGDPRRHMQIITRLYPDKATVLNGFDIDCCCFGFDGSRVMATPRAIAAVNLVRSVMLSTSLPT